MRMVTEVVEIVAVLSLFLPPFFFGVSILIYTTSLPSFLPYTWTVDGLC